MNNGFSSDEWFEKKMGPAVAFILFLVMVWLIFLMVAEARADQLRVVGENDFMYGDDADLTHATRVEWNRDSGWRFGAAQSMYTPKDLRNEDQVPGRHPYAGTLVGFVGYRPVQKFFAEPPAPGTAG